MLNQFIENGGVICMHRIVHCTHHRCEHSKIENKSILQQIAGIFRMCHKPNCILCYHYHMLYYIGYKVHSIYIVKLEFPLSFSNSLWSMWFCSLSVDVVSKKIQTIPFLPCTVVIYVHETKCRNKKKMITNHKRFIAEKTCHMASHRKIAQSRFELNETEQIR